MTTTITAHRAWLAPNRRRGRWLGRLLADRAAMVSLAFLVVLAVVAAAAGLLAPHDPAQLHLERAAEGPSGDFWLGTDGKGRDVLSRLVFASRIALVAASEAVGLALLFGAGLGLVAGYAGRITDAVLSRLFDSLMILPGLVLALAIVGVLGPGLGNAMVAIGVLLSPSFFRIARSGTKAAKEAPFIDAARVSGCGARRIIVRHIVPNIASPLLVQTSFAIGIAILAESGLSYLGLGVRPPTPSWGSMLDEAFSNFYRARFPVLPPVAMIVATILATSVLGDGLRDAISRGRDRS